MGTEVDNEWGNIPERETPACGDLGGQDEGAGLAYIYYCNLSVTRRASGK